MSQEQVIPMMNVDDDKWKSLAEDLKEDLKDETARFQDVYLIDDFAESGTTFIRFPTDGGRPKGKLAKFDLDADRRPVAPLWSGEVLENMGDSAGAMKLYALLCDRDGFDDEPMKGQACERLGTQELAAGQIEDGRRHLWHSARISRNMNDSGEFGRKLTLVAGGRR